MVLGCMTNTCGSKSDEFVRVDLRCSLNDSLVRPTSVSCCFRCELVVKVFDL